MEVIINGRKAVIPTSLHEYTLGQRIDFQLKYGNELDKMAASIQKMEEGVLKELEVIQYMNEKMVRTMAFFLDITPESITESSYIEDIARYYYSSAAVLLEEEKDIQLEPEILWDDNVWEISSPEVIQGSKMTFGEFIDAKQMVSQLYKLGASHWESMLPLCAIYLRKKGEPYQEHFLYEGSERLEKMRSLPMSIALQVGFFLSAIVNISTNILKYSGHSESKDQVLSSKSTLTPTAG